MQTTKMQHVITTEEFKNRVKSICDQFVQSLKKSWPEVKRIPRRLSMCVERLLTMATRLAVITIAAIMLYDFAIENPELWNKGVSFVLDGFNAIGDNFVAWCNNFIARCNEVLSPFGLHL